MSPNETLFLESTNKIYKDDISSSSFVNFQIWDFPGQVDFFDPTFDYEMIFRGTGALIFVIDAQVKLGLFKDIHLKVVPILSVAETVCLKSTRPSKKKNFQRTLSNRVSV